MEQASRAQVALHRALRRTPLALAASLALVGSAAFADDLKSVDGILQFDNVQVVNAPQAASTSAAPQGGMRAYRDAAGSPLRGPSTEEMAAAAAASTSAVARRASVADAASAPVYAAPGGGVTAVLDESYLQYSVVVRQPDGSLAEVCVTGADSANALVEKATLKSVARKETRNDR